MITLNNKEIQYLNDLLTMVWDTSVSSEEYTYTLRDVCAVFDFILTTKEKTADDE